MPKYKLILRKIATVLLVLIMIYFAIGFLAALVMIIIEATTHQMSSEIQQDQPSFQVWIIYVGMIIIMLFSAGLVFSAYLGYKGLKNIGNQNKEKEIEKSSI